MKIEGDVSVRSLFYSGIRILSHHARWVSSSGLHVTVASSILTVAAALVLAGRGRSFQNLILSWPSSSETETLPEKFWVFPGLQNLGNNCFLNVILQALASCSSFRSSLQRIVEEYEASSEDEQSWDMPLAVSLNALLQELCIIHHEREVLSPRNVMLAMSHYLPDFNLTRQQDAEEAFSYLLSSLREELSLCYAPNPNSLAVALGSSRIITQRRGIYSELERWTHSFLGPFNGIVGSILTCQSCSFQISLDFQFFNCLHLSPLTYGSHSIMLGCSIEDCLKKFFVAEQLENFFCSNCWHTAAIKYLSLLNKNETDIEKLRSCSKQDSCDCKNISYLEALPWSNTYSCTFKQLYIARNPKILCLNLQRASVNAFGELVKLQGHTSFPLTLNMSLFQNSEVQIKHFEESFTNGQSTEPYQKPIRYPNFLGVQYHTNPLNGIYKQEEESNLTGTAVVEEDRKASSEAYGIGDIEIQAIDEKQTGSRLDMASSYTAQHNCKVGITSSLMTRELHAYHLVSVVEHFGSTGSGHYTVYRKVSTNVNYADGASSEPSSVRWVGISDSQVYNVSEEDVLAAQGSLLFYEQVSES